MALNFLTAIYAWTTCFTVTIGVSLAIRQQKSVDDILLARESLKALLRGDPRRWSWSHCGSSPG